MSSSELLNLVSHNGVMLTEEEILLSQIFDRREAAKRAAEAEALAERKMLVSSASSINRTSILRTAKIPAQQNADKGEGEDDKIKSSEVLGRQPDLNSSQSNGSEDAAETKVSTNSEEAPQKQRKRTAESLTVDSDAEGEAIRNDFAETVSTKEAPRKSSIALKKSRKATADADEDDDEEVIVDMDTLDATALYASGFLSHVDWEPSMSSQPMTHILRDFVMVPSGATGSPSTGNNTLVLQCSVPENPRRWSINLCPENHNRGTYVFLHFNPRYNKNRLILNNKQGMWGSGVGERMSREGGRNLGTTALLSKHIELMISIRETGFAVFANGKCCSFFPHRTDISKLKTLAVILNRTDDNGVLETITFHKVWWGHRDPALDPVPAALYTDSVADEVDAFIKRRDAEANASTSETTVSVGLTARMLQVTGLPVHHIDQEVLELEKLLFSIFEEYNPEDIHVDIGTDSGYVRLPSVDACLAALDSMQGVGFEASDGEQYFLDLTRFKKDF